MTEDVTALRAALRLLRQPLLIASMRTERLPGGVRTILQVLAGDSDVLTSASATCDRKEKEIGEACHFFAEQILLFPGADHFRALGADVGESAPELRRNMALLMQWLHPDHAQGDQRAALIGRVTAAWEHLKVNERRVAYAESLRTSQQTKRRARQGSGPRPPARVRLLRSDGGGEPLLRRLLRFLSLR